MNELRGDETIHRIEQVYHAQYDPYSDLSAFDQLEICEAYAEAEEEHKKKYGITSEGVSVKWSVSGTYKRSADLALNESKQRAITELKTCNYRTPPLKVAQLLDQLFIDYDSKPGHWMYIAQYYSPRTINWVINGMIKAHRLGWQTIQNPPAYFTKVLKSYYKERKRFRRK